MNLCPTNTHFSVEFCDDCLIAGHLIIRPLQTVATFADLPEEALTLLGPILAKCYSAMNAIIKPERIYTLSFCEVLPALHFHLFPRTESLTYAYNKEHHSEGKPMNGALYFDWARQFLKHTPHNYHALQNTLRAELLD